MPKIKPILGRILEYLSSDISHPRVGTILRLIYLGGVLAILSWFIFFALSTIVNPYPIEYREGAAQVMTQFLLIGKNPFSLENQPLAMNNYGIGYNLVVWPFAFVFGNTLFIHRVVTFLFLFFSLFLISKTVFRLNKDILLASSCGILIAIGLAGRGGLGAFPTSMGSFLFLAAILIPFNRSFGVRGLCLSALFSLMAYYTKPYFMLSFGIVASYIFIFVSKKKGLLYSLFYLLVFIFSCLVVRFVFKLYFIDTLISNLSNANRSLGFLGEQMGELVREYYPGIFVAFAALLLVVFGHIRSTNSFEETFGRLNFQSLDLPLISKPFNYSAYFLLCSWLVFIFILGLHRGTFMSYIYQIIIPPLFLWLFQKLGSQPRLALISMPLLLFNAVWICQVLLNPAFLDQGDSKAWAGLYQYVDSSQAVLNSPIIVSEMIRLGMQPVDSGQTGYYYQIKPFSENILLGPSYDAIKEQGQQYNRTINEKIKNQEFARLILVEGDRSLYPFNLIDQYYSQEMSFPVEMPQTFEQWTIEIWEPKGSIQDTNP